MGRTTTTGLEMFEVVTHRGAMTFQLESMLRTIMRGAGNVDTSNRIAVGGSGEGVVYVTARGQAVVHGSTWYYVGTILQVRQEFRRQPDFYIPQEGDLLAAYFSGSGRYGLLNGEQNASYTIGPPEQMYFGRSAPKDVQRLLR